MSRSISKPDRRRLVWKKTGGICAHCGKETPAHLQTIDHYVPRANDGGFDLRNLMPLCKTCNMRRSSDEIEPERFYRYAPAGIIEELKMYRELYCSQRRTMSGKVY